MGFMTSEKYRDFHEGVRALLVDKDKNPQWTHKYINQVTQEEIDWFFDRRTENYDHVNL